MYIGGRRKVLRLYEGIVCRGAILRVSGIKIYENEEDYSICLFA